MQSEVSQKEKTNIIYVESEEIGADDLIYKAKIETDIENKHRDAKGGCGGGWDELSLGLTYRNY